MRFVPPRTLSTEKNFCLIRRKLSAFSSFGYTDMKQGILAERNRRPS